MSILTDHAGLFTKAIEHFKNDISTLKTGRANPSILDNIQVEAYGARTPLNQLGSISVPEARCILIQPWDKSVLKNIETAIRESDLNLSPVNEGEKIRISLPMMTEENRKAVVKVLHQKMEEARIALRKVRDEIRTEITRAEEEKEISEDLKFQSFEELDKKTSEFNDLIKKIGEEKEKEVMTI